MCGCDYSKRPPNLYTAKCLNCGGTPTQYTGHVQKDHYTVTAGWCRQLCRAEYSVTHPPDGGHFGTWEPRMGISDGPVWNSRGSSSDDTLSLPTTAAVNDHTCPSCGNNRCSKAEVKCWKCGGVL